MSFTDLTKGIYRRLYSGAVTGVRINKVSDLAERLFWRLNMIVDGFGNYHGEPALIKAGSFPRRPQVTLASVARALDELVNVNLVERYEVAGEAYIHIVGFEELQPQQFNSRRNLIPRIKRFPTKDYEGLRTFTKGHDEIRPETETETETETKPPLPPKGGAAGWNKSKRGAGGSLADILSRIPGRKTQVGKIAESGISVAGVIGLWHELHTDKKINSLLSVMAARISDGDSLPPCTPKAVVSAIGAGLVRSINGQDVTTAKMTHNAKGVYIDGKLFVPAGELEGAEYA